MGGTTAKASMVENGAVVKTSDFEVGAGINLSSKLAMGGGHALKLPVIDVSEIGAGGGSIVAVDRHGRLQVGPESAGAVARPRVLRHRRREGDADGYARRARLPESGLPRGRRDAARRGEGPTRPCSSRWPDRSARNLLEAAHGVQVVAGATMMRAVKAVSTYRGRDPRDFDLFAFGGSGPVLATEVARQLGMRRVIVPPNPGLFSAFGLLLSNIEHEFVQTFFRRSTEVGAGELEAICDALEAGAHAALEADGFEPEERTITRQADLRYSGQAYELTVPIGRNGTGAIDVADVVEAFGEEHLRTYGHRAEDEPVDLVSVRVIGEAEPLGPRVLDPGAAVCGHEEPGDRDAERGVYFGRGHGSLDTHGGRASGSLDRSGGGTVDRGGVRCDLRGPAGVARVPGRHGQHRHRNRMKRHVERNRSRHLRSHQERTGFAGRRDGAGHHAQRPFGGLPRPRWTTRPVSADARGRDGRARADDPDAHEERSLTSMRTLLEQWGDDMHPGDVFITNDPYGRRGAAPSRHLRDEADLPRRPHRGIRGDAGPPHRRREASHPAAPRSTPPRSTRKACASPW